MKYLYLVIFVSLLIAGYLAYHKNKPAEATPSPITVHELNEDKLFDLVNRWRVSQKLQPYVKDERLCVIAKDRVDDGLDYHKGFYAKYSNYPYVIQENSIWDSNSEQEALKGWLNSPPHRKTLEAPYAYTCIATHKYDTVQIFSSFSK